MDCILDTHTLIWFLNGDDNLSMKARDAIEDQNNAKYISIASIWEIAIKISLNKFKFEQGFEKFLNLIDENGFEIIPISYKHALTVSSLKFIHRDPFDRLILAQAISDKATIITKDAQIKEYEVKTVW